MLNKLFYSFIFLITLFLVGCSATGPKFTNLQNLEESKAIVYVYRPWMILDGAAAPTIQVDGVDHFDLSNGGYQILNLKPGEHKLTVKKGTFMSNWRAGEMNIKYSFKGNRIYFMRLSAELEDAAYLSSVMSISGLYSFGLVNEKNALAELKKTKKN